MGTRGAIGIQINGDIKATYNHWDSYPECLGQQMLEFVKVTNMPYFKQKISAIRWLDGDSKPTEKEQRIYSATHDHSVDDGKSWYSLLRHTQGAKGFALIAINDLDVLIDNSGFLDESLFCEWAYILNYDTNCLDIYKGFQELPNCKKDNPKYGRCKCICSIHFDKACAIDNLAKYLKDSGSYTE